MKEKSKAHPFAGHLHDGEEILWMSGPPSTQWRDLMALIPIRRFYVISIGLAVLAILIALVLSDSLHLIPMMLIATAVALGLGLGPGLIETGALMAYNRYTNPPQTEIYALTDQQVLWRRGDTVSTLPLEHVPSLSLFGDRTLSFGAVFPMWSSLEDAQHVKHIIEQARKEHLKGDSL